MIVQGSMDIVIGSTGTDVVVAPRELVVVATKEQELEVVLTASGTPGPRGLQGIQGPPGVSTSSWQYTWRVDNTVPPNNGHFKTDTTNPAVATKVYMSLFDKSGSMAIGLLWVKAGETFYVYEQNSALYLSYRATADAINHDDQWIEIPVVLVLDNGFTPGNGKPIYVVAPLDKSGIDASSLAYRHVQGVPAAIWVIDHTLGFMPSVTAVDSAGMYVIGDIEYTSSSQVVLHFSGAFSGEAFLT